MVSGHIDLNRHLFKMGKVRAQLAGSYDDEETPYHLIYNYLLTRQKIRQLEGNIGERR
ncbi:Hypothetical protein FKW44_013636, partial [Caligus rogercresseyi]